MKESEDIICKDKYGEEYTVTKETLQLRIGVCGILVRDDGILLIHDQNSQKWELPGGGVELGESLDEALSREFLEETGLPITRSKILTFRESFYYMREEKKAFQSYRLFFSVVDLDNNLQPTTGSFLKIGELQPETTNELTFSVLTDLFHNS